MLSPLPGFERQSKGATHHRSFLPQPIKAEQTGARNPCQQLSTVVISPGSLYYVSGKVRRQ
jgi:hypothetical protein